MHQNGQSRGRIACQLNANVPCSRIMMDLHQSIGSQRHRDPHTCVVLFILSDTCLALAAAYEDSEDVDLAAPICRAEELLAADQEVALTLTYLHPI